MSTKVNADRFWIMNLFNVSLQSISFSGKFFLQQINSNIPKIKSSPRIKKNQKLTYSANPTNEILQWSLLEPRSSILEWLCYNKSSLSSHIFQLIHSKEYNQNSFFEFIIFPIESLAVARPHINSKFFFTYYNLQSRLKL
ncbi:hypothetical protein HanHA300_Chr13g0490231 [Helianthus annuus]|nr:hypothetical protein HanHA300_Chr13g0490231 [Helianthus annuus]KAJ0498413.1 hypothetical protein HanHA89_Chr13g0522341 [Helianthus annuus]KAJ0664424.1 hypothetical protein HanLR1_Chr13g0492281 [Helianthus annuus]